MSRNMIFDIDGRIIVLERFQEETDVMFSERSSFVLAFRNNSERFEQAKKYSMHHSQKMFNGATYKPEVEVIIRELRELYLQLKVEDEEYSRA